MQESILHVELEKPLELCEVIRLHVSSLKWIENYVAPAKSQFLTLIKLLIVSVGPGMLLNAVK